MKYKNEIIIFLIAILFYSLFNANIAITDPVEANYALTAKEMFMQADYLNLIIYGQYWYDKPIFIYWSLLASYAVWGINAFAARLPMAVASALTLSYLYWFVKRLYNKKIAMISVLVLATSLEYWIVSKMIITDSLLFLFDCAALGMVYLALQENNKSWLYWAYGAAALAVLTKGPVGIVLPGLIAFTYLLGSGNLSKLKILLSVKGIGIFLLLALPWYLYMYIQHGQAFIEGFLGLHNFTRALVAEHPKDNIIFYYFIVFPLAILPWSIIWCRHAWQMLSNWRAAAKSAELYLYAWIIVTILFYTLVATKYLTYIYISLFPAAIITAVYLNNHKYTYRQLYWDTASSILLMVSAVLVFMFNISKTAPVNSFNIAYIMLAILIVLLVYLKWRAVSKAAMVYGIVGCNVLLIAIATFWIIPYYAQLRSSSDIAAYLPPNAFVASFGDYQTSLLFYQNGKMIRVVKDEDYTAAHGVWQQKNVMPTQSISEFKKAINGEKSVYFIVAKKNYQEFQNLPISKEFIEIETGERDIIFVKRN